MERAAATGFNKKKENNDFSNICNEHLGYFQTSIQST